MKNMGKKKLIKHSGAQECLGHTRVREAEARMRRSLTIAPENDRKLQNIRSMFLDGQTPYDLDYTTTTNIFIELGHKLFLAWAVAKKMGQTQAIVGVDEVPNTIFRYGGDMNLKDEAAMDLMTDMLYRRLEEQNKKLMQQLQHLQQTREATLPIVQK